MSFKEVVIIGIAAVATLFVVGFAAAQSNVFAGLAQPILVAIDQTVPADVTLAIPQDDGTILTTTVPITVGVSLQIAIDGASVVSVEPAVSTEDPAVTVESVAPSHEPGTIVSQSALSQTVDGVTVEMLSLEFLPFDQYAEANPDSAERLVRLADNSPAAAGILTVRVINHSDASVRVIPIQQAAIVAGGEQIDLGNFYMLIDNDIDTTYFPEASKQGGVTFAVPDYVWNAIAAGGTAAYYIDTDDDREYAFKIELAPAAAN